MRDAVVDASRGIPLVYRHVRQFSWPPYVGRQWNAAIGMSSGDYVAFLDDDDAKAPGFSRQMSAPLESDWSVDIVLCCGETIDSISGRLFGTPSLERSVLLCGGFVTTGQMLVRRNLFDRIKFDESLPVSEDFDFLLSLSSNDVKHVVLQDTLTYYRKHDSNITCDPRVGTTTPVALRMLLTKHGEIGTTCSRCGEPLQPIPEPERITEGGWNWVVGKDGGSRWSIFCGFCG